MRKIFSLMMCLFFVITMINCVGGGSSKQLTEGETISNGIDSLDQLTDRQSLVIIYDALNGAEWDEFDRENWLTDKPIGEWRGVKTNDEGRVIELNLGGPDKRGLLPVEIGGLTELEYLKISVFDLGFDNVIPAEIGRLTKLKHLWLSASNTPNPDKTILPDLSTLVNLEELVVLGVGGAIPENIGQLRKLRILNLWAFEGEIPESICELTNLEELSLTTFYQPVGAVPENIGRLSKLKLLEIDYGESHKVKQPNAKFPESMWDLTNLETLRMRSLSNDGGPIPGDKVAKMTNVKEITIVKCGITGTIPAELFALEKLTHLRINNNKLTGSIPSEIGNCTNLYFLYLDNNQLTGNIPDELAKCEKLAVLNLSGNQLSPVIPEGLKKHPNFNDFRFIPSIN